MAEDAVAKVGEVESWKPGELAEYDGYVKRLSGMGEEFTIGQLHRFKLLREKMDTYSSQEKRRGKLCPSELDQFRELSKWQTSHGDKGVRPWDVSSSWAVRLGELREKLEAKEKTPVPVPGGGRDFPRPKS